MRNGGAAHKSMEAPRNIEVNLKRVPPLEKGAAKGRDRLPRRGRTLQNGKANIWDNR